MARLGSQSSGTHAVFQINREVPTRFGQPYLRGAKAAQREGAIMKSNSVPSSVVLLILALSGATWAQTGSITGTVKDSTGAAIVGANVVVASPERGITRRMTTNSTGEYNESALPAGRERPRLQEISGQRSDPRCGTEGACGCDSRGRCC